MIKLFWNTHNEIASDSDKSNEKDVTTDSGWGIYHKKNSNLWVYEILKKIKYDIVENETNIERDDTLIIVDSNPEKKI